MALPMHRFELTTCSRLAYGASGVVRSDTLVNSENPRCVSQVWEINAAGADRRLNVSGTPARSETQRVLRDYAVVRDCRMDAPTPSHAAARRRQSPRPPAEHGSRDENHRYSQHADGAMGDGNARIIQRSQPNTMLA